MKTQPVAGPKSEDAGVKNSSNQTTITSTTNQQTHNEKQGDSVTKSETSYEPPRQENYQKPDHNYNSGNTGQATYGGNMDGNYGQGGSGGYYDGSYEDGEQQGVQDGGNAIADNYANTAIKEDGYVDLHHPLFP